MDLTGIWTANDGSIYAVRQIGNLVRWVGLSDPFEFHRGTRFTNVFSTAARHNRRREKVHKQVIERFHCVMPS